MAVECRIWFAQRSEGEPNRPSLLGAGLKINPQGVLTNEKKSPHPALSRMTLSLPVVALGGFPRQATTGKAKKKLVWC